MMKQKTARHGLLIFSALVVLLTFCLPYLPLSGEGTVYENTIRLHVSANSDSTEDQTLKCEVRDSVLAVMADYSKNCRDKQEAEELIKELMPKIKAAAEDTVEKKGYDYALEVSLEEEYYPTREYDGVNLPAGNYTSLHVMIGDAVGQNWWCVLYPSLCTGVSSPTEELRAAGFTPEQIRVLTDGESPKYVVRFKFLEILGEIFG